MLQKTTASILRGFNVPDVCPEPVLANRRFHSAIETHANKQTRLFSLAGQESVDLPRQERDGNHISFHFDSITFSLHGNLSS
eukprot:COSAG06_NODE_5591_length_3378_cov_1.351327_3_plen_82_part_00